MCNLTCENSCFICDHISQVLANLLDMYLRSKMIALRIFVNSFEWTLGAWVYFAYLHLNISIAASALCDSTQLSCSSNFLLWKLPSNWKSVSKFGAKHPFVVWVIRWDVVLLLHDGLMIKLTNSSAWVTKSKRPNIQGQNSIFPPWFFLQNSARS